MREEVVEFAGSRLRMLRAGAGDTLLYVHGSGDAGVWLPAQSRLAEHFAVHRPDLPGYNGSESRADTQSVPAMAERLWELADELLPGGSQQGSIRLVGSSLGGWISAEMAAQRPDRVSHLVLLDAVGLEPRGGFPVNQFTMSPREIVEAVYATEPLREQAAADARQRQNDPVAAAWMAGNGATTRALGEHPYFHDPSLAARLAGVTAKTLVLWGAEDGLVPVQCGREYEQAIPGARLEILADCGHLPLVEQPAEALALILPFLHGAR